MGIPLTGKGREVSDALGPFLHEVRRRQRKSQAQSSVENRWVKRLAGVRVLFPGQRGRRTSTT